MDQEQLGGGRADFWLIFCVTALIEGSQSRNLEAETEGEAIEEHCLEN